MILRPSSWRVFVSSFALCLLALEIDLAAPYECFPSNGTALRLAVAEYAQNATNGTTVSALYGVRNVVLRLFWVFAVCAVLQRLAACGPVVCALVAFWVSAAFP